MPKKKVNLDKFLVSDQECLRLLDYCAFKKIANLSDNDEFKFENSLHWIISESSVAERVAGREECVYKIT